MDQSTDPGKGHEGHLKRPRLDESDLVAKQHSLYTDDVYRRSGYEMTGQSYEDPNRVNWNAGFTYPAQQQPGYQFQQQQPQHDKESRDVYNQVEKSESEEYRSEPPRTDRRSVTQRLLNVLCPELLSTLILDLLDASPELEQYLDQRLEQYSQCRRLMVRNINFISETEEFRNLFSQYGIIEDSTIVRNKDTKKSKGFGFVTYKYLSSVRAALASSLVLDGRNLHVKLAAAAATPTVEEVKPKYSEYRRKLFLRNLSPNTTSTTLRSSFEEFGEIEDCIAVTDHATGRGKGYGFVTFVSPYSAEKAIEQSQRLIDDRYVYITYASPDHQTNKKSYGKPPPPPQQQQQQQPYMYYLPSNTDLNKQFNVAAAAAAYQTDHMTNTADYTAQSIYQQQAYTQPYPQQQSSAVYRYGT